jgi:hypothetical protein
MKSFPSLLLLCFLLKHSSVSAQVTTKASNNTDYCRVLDSLVTIRSYTYGNSYANKVIPKLAQASRIDAHCDRGFFGYIYRSEEDFKTDIANWRKYFNCKIKTVLLSK